MVKAAYSSGTPAIGVGAGNGPAYIHRSADVRLAVKRILDSKTFDNGTICASEQSIVVTREMEAAVSAELKAQGESDRIDFRLQLAGVRNVKAARAILADHGDDIDKLKEAEPWLFADAPAMQPSGTTGLPNAGTCADAGKTMKRWRRLAGLDYSNDNA